MTVVHENGGGFTWEEIPPDTPSYDLMVELRKAQAAVRRKRYLSSSKGRAASNAYAKSDKRKAGKAKYAQDNPHMRHVPPFVGVDGEGNNDAYYLLRAGDHVLYHDDGSRLSSYECLSFLCDLPRDNTYVIYFGDYDVTRMLHPDVPPERIRRLLNPLPRKHGGKWPMDWHGFDMEYMPGKHFKVRRKGEREYFTLNDVGSFFQASFVKTITAWNVCTPGELDLITKSKADRGGEAFATLTQEIIDYNALECDVLARLMSKFLVACRGIGYLPITWQGPGQLAERILQVEGAVSAKDLADSEHFDPELMTAARKSYYGGRFEITAAGWIDEPLYNLDINSAYPDAIRRLPCLRHGKWEHGKKPTGDLFLAFGTYAPNSDRIHYLYGFPNRDAGGNISYPAVGKGWYWSHEIAEAKHQKFNIAQAFSYSTDCDCDPFPFVEPLYVKRKELARQAVEGALMNQGITIKLALNSLYGKMCQSVGSPRYANPIYASLITSLTRAKLYGMVHELSDCDKGGACGEHVYSLATDGICAGRTTAKDVGEGLGEWEAKDIEGGVFFIQPGFQIGTHTKSLKSRGVSAELLAPLLDQFVAAFGRLVDLDNVKGRDVWGRFEGDVNPFAVTITAHQFVGLKQAAFFGHWDICGTFVDLDREVTFTWTGKRDLVPVVAPDGRSLRTLPKPGRKGRETLGYSKDIGGMVDAGRPYETKRVWQDGQPEESTAFEDWAMGL